MKKKLLLYCLVAAAGLFGGRCACDNSVSSNSPTLAPTGAVSVNLEIGAVGGLPKAAAINLAKAYLELSAAGETTLKDSFSLSGSAAQTVTKTHGDLHVKAWKAKAWTKDQNGVVIHSDSVNFTIVENDTIPVSLALSAKFSNFVAIFPTISDSAKYCDVWINGVKVADSTFGKNSGLSEVRLYFDYLPASPDPGTSVTIVMNIRGDWVDQDTLLWTGQAVVKAISGQDISQPVTLAWVGPQVGGVGVTIIIGRVATVTATGNVQPRPNTTP